MTVEDSGAEAVCKPNANQQFLFWAQRYPRGLKEAAILLSSFSSIAGRLILDAGLW